MPDRVRYGEQVFLAYPSPPLPECFSSSASKASLGGTVLGVPVTPGNFICFWNGPCLTDMSARGHVANWFVEDDFLYFQSATGEVYFGEKFQVFSCTISVPNVGHSVVADWFSGSMRLRDRPPSNRLDWPGGICPETRTIVLEVASGRVVSTAVVNEAGEYLEPVRSTIAETPFPAERLRLTLKNADTVRSEFPVSWECDRRGGTVGSAPESDWLIPSPYVSRRHLSISYEEGKFILKPYTAPISHIRRRNYIKTPAPLQNGEKIWIGRHEIEVTVLG